MSFESGNMTKGLVTSIVEEANEKAAVEKSVAENTKKNQTFLAASIDQRAKAVPKDPNAVRFATSFPQIKFIMPDGKALIFRGGFLDVSETTEVAELRKAIQAGNRQIWEVKA